MGNYTVQGGHSLNLGNDTSNDNITVLLVHGYSGNAGQDLDTNDDGVLNVTPWAGIDDSVGWYDPDVPGGLALEERRHWHRACWERRLRRAPGGRRT